MPSVSYEQLRENYKRACDCGAPNPVMLASWLCEEVGLTDGDGRYRVGEDGFPKLAKDRKRSAADFPIALLAEAMIGRDWVNVLGLNSSASVFPYQRMARVSEEAFAPIGPSHLFNVNAWSAAVGGLIQASMLEGYETADFDLVGLFPTRPVTFWNGGERYVDVIGPSKPAPKIGVGEPHPDARVDGIWVEPGPLAVYGHKVTIAKETAFADVTGGQVLQRAKNLGYGIKFRESELILDIITGTTNNFRLGLTADTAATTYNTYGATVPTGLGTTAALGNDLTNPMVDPITTFQASDDALTAYKHPITGLPMPVFGRMNTILLPTTLNNWAMFLNGLGNVTILNQPALPAPAPAGTFPTGSMTGNNPYQGRFNIRVSQWIYDKHTRSTTQVDPDISAGLGLTAANARRWYRLDPQRFAARRAAWEFNSTDFSPTAPQMADQRIIGGACANIGVMYQVLAPWYIQRNKVS